LRDRVDRKVKYFVAQTHDPASGRSRENHRADGVFGTFFIRNNDKTVNLSEINSASSLFYGGWKPASHIPFRWADKVDLITANLRILLNPKLSPHHSYLIHSHLIKMFGLRAWPTPVRSPSCGNPHDPVSSKHSTDTYPLLFFSPVYSSPDPWLPSSLLPSSPTWESPSCRTWPSTVRLLRRGVLEAGFGVWGFGYRRAG
jgi:hypothetical protein